MKRLWVIGAGGHAKVVIEAARESGRFEVQGCLDDNPELAGQVVLEVPIFVPVSCELIRSLEVERAVLAVGSNLLRSQLAERLSHLVTWESVMHPKATVSSYSQIGAGSVICAGSVIQAGAAVGDHAIVNTSASIDHDSRVGDFAHIGPGARLAGNVGVGAGGFVGIGASVAPGIQIGSWAIVGAGGVVINDVPNYTTVVGVPARAIKMSSEKA